MKDSIIDYINKNVGVMNMWFGLGTDDSPVQIQR